jgi:rod shape-determining protein MreC
MPIYKNHTNRSGRSPSGFIAFGVFVLSVITLFLPDASQDELASLLRGSLLRPFILTQEGLVRRSIHAEDTEVLQRRLDSLEVVIANSNSFSEENATLRRLLLLSDRNPAQYVAASVIRSGTPGSESMFMLDVGTRRGVTRDSPVMMGSGLLGVVRDAQANRAIAMDWTHPQFRASAMTVDGSIYGMVRAAPGRFREADRLLLNGVPFRQELGPGVALVTSGLGGVYPRGIPIGVVIEESGSQEGWQRSYWLRPFVSPGEATHAMVLVSEEGESRDANSWLEGGPLAPGPAAATQGPAPGTPGTEARIRR